MQRSAGDLLTLPPYTDMQWTAVHSAGLRMITARIAGTIPDSTPLSDSGADQLGGLPASVQAAPDIEPGCWDQYFDQQQDIRLDERGATFRQTSKQQYTCTSYCALVILGAFLRDLADSDLIGRSTCRHQEM